VKTKKPPIPRQSYVQKLKKFCGDNNIVIISEINYAHVEHSFKCNSGHIFKKTPKSLLHHLPSIPCPFCVNKTPHNKIYTQEYIITSIKNISQQLGFIPSPSELREIKMDSFNGGSVYALLSTKYEKEIVPILQQETNLDYGSKYFFINGNRYKSKIEVYFVNFFIRHKVNFDYEPTKFDFNGFSKIPDFKIGGKYYDIAGYHSERYENKLVESVIEFNKKNIPYEVIKVNLEDLFRYDFYIKLCVHFSVSPIFKSFMEVYKNLIVWDKSQYDDDINNLKSLLNEIYNISYKSDEYKKINSLIKKLSLKNIKIACEYLNISFNGRRIKKHGLGKIFNTPKCVQDGTLKTFLQENPNISIREIERLNLFNVSRRTMSKYKKEWFTS
jgi:hypothetical protein